MVFFITALENEPATLLRCRRDWRVGPHPCFQEGMSPRTEGVVVVHSGTGRALNLGQEESALGLLLECSGKNISAKSVNLELLELIFVTTHREPG